MGTWGTGPFDNDHAADFAGDLDGADAADRPALIRDALRAALDGDDVDGYVGDIAVAAAAVVASQRPGGEPVHPVYGPDEPVPSLPAEVGEVAVRALERVLGPGSELPELWGEGPDGGVWEVGVRRMLAVIAGGSLRGVGGEA